MTGAGAGAGASDGDVASAGVFAEGIAILISDIAG